MVVNYLPSTPTSKLVWPGEAKVSAPIFAGKDSKALCALEASS